MICRSIMILGTIMFFILSSSLLAQTEETSEKLMEDAPKVFIDSEYTDLEYVRNKVNFINYVRDRQLADVSVLVTTMRTASGGRQKTLRFTGKNRFSGMVDTLMFNNTSFDTEDEKRNSFIRTFKLGLMPFILKTPMAKKLSIGFDGNGNIKEVKDKWDYWVFRMRVGGGISGEQIRDSYRINGNFNADRITEDWKIRLDTDIYYDEESFSLEDDTSWTSSSKSFSTDLSIAKSISQHFSLGLMSRVSSSTYRNLQSNYEFFPAIEYNLFPYSESTNREIRLSYFIGASYRYYNEETIYDKTSEKLAKQGLQLNIEIKEPWGEIDIRGEYTNFLHDLSKRRIQLWGWLSFKLFEGFSFDFGGGYSKIHDQLSLPKRELDIEEILLSRAELATQYSFKLSFGVSYTFGAIYNNIVNPRFGN